MILEQNGTIDYRDNGRYFNRGSGQWSNYSSWSTFDSWTKDPDSTLAISILDTIDLGSVQTVNLLADISCRGSAHYYVYYQDSSNDFVDSGPSYSVLHITNAQTNIPSIRARYIRIKVALDLVPGQGFQYLDNFTFRVSESNKKGQTRTYSTINSSTLAGSSSDRTFVPTDLSGSIKNAQVTSRGATASYNVDMYVAHSTTSAYTYPEVISTATDAVHLTFIGIDGRNRDSYFDITLETTPEWYMDSQGNLRER